MRLFSKILKSAIRIFFSVLNKSSAIKKFLFSDVLRDEIEFYVEQDYYSHYLHIQKACEFMSNKIKPNSIISDVGGADGTTAKIFSGYFPNNRVIIFEPIKENIIQLRKLHDLYPQWLIIPKAAGANVRNDRIHKAKRITSSSLLELVSDSESELFGSNLVETGTESIKITTLNKELRNSEHIAILKLDVQGYELEVLKGAAGILRKVSLIILELNNHSGYAGAPKYYQLDAYLRKYKFELLDLFPSTKEKGKLKEWDAIYINTQSL